MDMIITHNSNNGGFLNKDIDDEDAPVPNTMFGVSMYADAEEVGNTMMRKTKKTKKVKKMVKKKKKGNGLTQSSWRTDKAYIDDEGQE